MSQIRIIFKPNKEVSFVLHYYLEHHFNNMFSMVPISMKAGPLETVITYDMKEELRPQVKEALVEFFDLFKTEKFKVEEETKQTPV